MLFRSYRFDFKLFSSLRLTPKTTLTLVLLSSLTNPVLGMDDPIKDETTSAQATKGLLKEDRPPLDLEKIKGIPLIDGEKIKSVSSLGGVTNNNFKVTLNDEKSTSYVVKITNADHKEIVVGDYEHLNQNKAYSLMLAPKFEFCSSDKRIHIIQYLEGSCQKEVVPSNIRSFAALISKLHNIGLFENNNLFFEQLENINKKCINNKLNQSERSFDLAIQDAKEIFLKKEIKTTACHNDFTTENVLFTTASAPMLIDWEFSGNNDPAWDVAYFLTLSSVKEELWETFFDEYLKVTKIDDSFLERVNIYMPLALIYVGRILSLHEQNPKIKTEKLEELIRNCFWGAKEILASEEYKKSINNLKTGIQ